MPPNLNRPTKHRNLTPWVSSLGFAACWSSWYPCYLLVTCPLTYGDLMYQDIDKRIDNGSIANLWLWDGVCQSASVKVKQADSCDTTSTLTSTTTSSTMEGSCQVVRCKPGYLRRKAVSGSSATESTDHLAVPFASHAKRRGFSTSPFRIGCEDGSRMATVVKEHVFEANGCQYQFHCVRPFAWEDGTQFHLPKRVTLQALKRIDRNFAWWSTSHERTQRQRFKWVSPMHQKTRHAVTVDRIGFGAGVDTCRS